MGAAFSAEPPGPTPLRCLPDPTGAVRVVVIGGRLLAMSLQDVLPAGWWVEADAALDPDAVPDFVVLFDPDPMAVRRLTDRGVQVVALLDRRASSGDIVEVIDAGASICLRDHDPRLVAGYLVQRRRPARRSLCTTEPGR